MSSNETIAWLDKRYQMCDENGIYLAHQPIYGFRVSHCEPNIMPRYGITLKILRTLVRLDFSSVLDVGAAECYKAALIRDRLECEVTACDISAEACCRAHSIFGIQALQADISALPFSDGSFDVVVCSETLEHLPDYVHAVGELIRVCRKAVIVTVPFNEAVGDHGNDTHAHLHSFNYDSFAFLRNQGFKVVAEPINSSLFCRGFWRIENPRQPEENSPRARDIMWSLMRSCWNQHTAALALDVDEVFLKASRDHTAIMYLLVKDRSALLGSRQRRISALSLLSFRVPLHSLGGRP